MKVIFFKKKYSRHNTAWNVSKYGVFFSPYFPTFGLNTERYSVSLRIQSECGEILIRKNSVFWHFWRSASFKNWKQDFHLPNQFIKFSYFCPTHIIGSKCFAKIERKLRNEKNYRCKSHGTYEKKNKIRFYLKNHAIKLKRWSCAASIYLFKFNNRKKY